MLGWGLGFVERKEDSLGRGLEVQFIFQVIGYVFIGLDY